MIMRSFLDVFPHVTAWAGGNILVGSTEPLVIDADDYDTSARRAGHRCLPGRGRHGKCRSAPGACTPRAATGSTARAAKAHCSPTTGHASSSGSGRRSDRPLDLTALEGGDADDVIGR